MKKFKPDMYKKSIYDIDYNKLKEKEIKVLIYDFDNTIVEHGKTKVEQELKDLFKKLKKDFYVFIISNTLNKAKIDKFAKECDVNYVMAACKPFRRGFKKVKHLEKCKKQEICMIGDQLITDVYGSKRLGFLSILVEPIKQKEIIFTKFNRTLEYFVFKKLEKKYNIKKGNYYD